jgi:hypothetical protein
MGAHLNIPDMLFWLENSQITILSEFSELNFNILAIGNNVILTIRGFLNE